MPRYQDTMVRINGCTIVWDGITRPEPITQGKNAGGLKYSLKVVIPPNCPDVADLQALADETLMASEFRGVLPPGGYMPVGQTKPGEFQDMFPGHFVVSAKSNFAPDVYDEAGLPLDPMQYTPMVYTGQRVDILVHCYSYNEKAKGVAAGLDAFSIVASAAAPKLVLGTGRPDTTGAFGAQPAAGQPGFAAPAPTQPYGQPPAGQVPTGGYVQPTTAAAPAQPVQQQNFMPNPAPGGYDPQTGQPIKPIVGYDPHTGQPIYQT